MALKFMSDKADNGTDVMGVWIGAEIPLLLEDSTEAARDRLPTEVDMARSSSLKEIGPRVNFDLRLLRHAVCVFNLQCCFNALLAIGSPFPLGADFVPVRKRPEVKDLDVEEII